MIPDNQSTLRTVTAIIPTMNSRSNDRADLLRSVDSLLTQDLPPDLRLRIIIGDNGSNDNSQILIEQIASRYPQVEAVLRPTNIGGLNNINDLLERASNDDFVVIVADDDRCGEPDRLARLVSALDANPDAVMATGETIYRDGPTYVDRWSLADDPARVEALQSRDAADRVIAMVEVTDPINNADIFAMVRGETVRDIGGLSSIRGSDNVWLGRVAASGQIVVDPEAKFIREVGGLSTRPEELSAEGWAAKATTKAELVSDVTNAIATEAHFDVLGERRAEVVAHLQLALTERLVLPAEREAAGLAAEAERPFLRYSESNRFDNPISGRAETRMVEEFAAERVSAGELS
jgi:GT2 family glycosyltransferase